MTLDPVATRLSKLLGIAVRKTPDCVGAEVESLAAALKPGEVLLLENLRFHAGEEANDPEFAKQLASLCDVYINDAFGAAHRAHGSTAGIVDYVSECAAGLLMQRELEYLAMAVSNPPHPYIAIVGGAKISGKIDVIENFLTLADRVLIGGAMTYTFLKARGIEVGASLVEEEKLDLALRTMESAGDKLLLPSDHVIASAFAADAHTQVRAVSQPTPAGWLGLDIGPETISHYEAEIRSAKLIVWNGPMGVFEMAPFEAGTLAVARAVAQSDAVSIVGGGDSEKAVSKAGVGDRISHVSTGGGASLEFLAGKDLPGVVALGGI
jgi:phosphoglycerate kinase